MTSIDPKAIQAARRLADYCVGGERALQFADIKMVARTLLAAEEELVTPDFGEAPFRFALARADKAEAELAALRQAVREADRDAMDFAERLVNDIDTMSQDIDEARGMERALGILREKTRAHMGEPK